MSSPPLRVFLTSEQEKTLFELSKAPKVPQRTKDRASAIRLSAIGWKVEKIAVYLKWSKSTVRTAIHRYIVLFIYVRLLIPAFCHRSNLVATLSHFP